MYRGIAAAADVAASLGKFKKKKRNPRPYGRWHKGGKGNAAIRLSGLPSLPGRRAARYASRGSLNFSGEVNRVRSGGDQRCVSTR